MEYKIGMDWRMEVKNLAEGVPLEITHQQVLQQIEVIEECHRQNPILRFV